MQKIKKVIEKSKDMISFFNDLSLSKKVKKAQVQSILSANKYSPITLNFFNVVADNGRLAHTTKIINGFEEIMKGHRNEVTVTISSAKVFISLTKGIGCSHDEEDCGVDL